MRFVTEFERNKSLSLDMMSNIWKIFIMQFINTAIILVLVNADFVAVSNALPNFPLFTGKYTDLNAGWYVDVGSLIIFSLILNVFIPHMVVILDNWKTLCSRCCDSGCTCDGRNTKLKNKREYLELYVGPDFPIDCRYSELLTTIVVALTFSSGLPILYLCCFFFFFILNVLGR